MKSLPIVFTLLVLPLIGVSQSEVIGTTLPIREVDMSFPETGIIAELPVAEGDPVEPGQILGKLDTQVLDASLRIARIRAESDAALQSARATWKLRKRRFEELERLEKSGSANADEVARARAEFEIANADLEAIQEEAKSNRIQVEQIAAQIRRHTLTSPFQGVVTRIHREVGEIVQPGQGTVLTVVCLDSLYLVLHVDQRIAGRMELGQRLPVRALDPSPGASGPTPAEVAFISPVTDPASGTTRIKLVLENGEGRHRAGLKYRVDLSEVPGELAGPVKEVGEQGGER